VKAFDQKLFLELALVGMAIIIFSGAFQPAGEFMILNPDYADPRSEPLT